MVKDLKIQSCFIHDIQIIELFQFHIINIAILNTKIIKSEKILHKNRAIEN